MTEEDIINEIEYRKDVDYDCRFEPRDFIDSIDGYDVVERNGWKGILEGNSLLVPTIYDSVEIVQVGNIQCAIVTVFDKKGFYLLSDGCEYQILPCKYDQIQTNKHHRGVVMKRAGKEGLYSMRTMEVLFDCEFQKVSNNVDAYAVWAMIDSNSIQFIITASGEKIYQSGALMAFESEHGILFQDNDGIVRLLNSSGNIDRYGFRSLVVGSHGRLGLSNSRESRLQICDISGYIIS